MLAKLSERLVDYRRDPSGYCRDVLGVRLTPTQEQIAQALVEPPHRVLVKAGHNVGKSFLAACLINWWFDSFEPGICLTTAPTDRQVKDILWKEVRVLRKHRGGFPGPKIPRLEAAPNHFAHGFTSIDGNTFQGHHSDAVFIVFDEATGVDRMFWEAAEPMLGGSNHAFLAIFNPTDVTSHAYQACQEAGARVIEMSCLDHPNVVAECAGLPAPYPSAIRLPRLLEMLAKWSEEIDEPAPGCVTLAGRHFMPGPVAEARLLGRWPSSGSITVWSLAAWEHAASIDLPDAGPLEFGVDVARFGDDATAIHGRRGGRSFFHLEANGWDTVQTVRETCRAVWDAARARNLQPKSVPIKVDDTGVGGGVTDGLRAEGFSVFPINFAAKALFSEKYPNRRSELWFELADAARRGEISFKSLNREVRDDLGAQLLSPNYHLDHKARRVVEPKKDTKKRLGRSPDSADSVMLAYANVHFEDRVSGVHR